MVVRTAEGEHEEDVAVALRTKTRRDKLRSAAEDVRSSVQPAAESALEKLESATEQLVTTVGPAIEDARDRVKPKVEDAKERLGPMVEDARERLTPLAQQAMVEGKVRGRRAAVKLGLAEEPKKKSHKLRNFVILLGIGGLAAFLYKKMTGKDADPAWTASRDSAAARPPAHAAGGTPAGASSAGATSASDTSAGSHASSTATGPVDGSETAPTAPLASEETVESPTPTTPDKPLKEKKI
jgi:hypothetical protein